MVETHRIPIRLASGELAEIILEIELLPSQNCVIKCREKTWPFYAEESDFFIAMQELRYFLESKNVQLLCHGSRVDVWPSAMSRDMGSGLTAYVCPMGQAGGDGMVKIFEADAAIEYATVDEQRAYHEEWFRSIGKQLPSEKGAKRTGYMGRILGQIRKVLQTNK